MPMNIRHISTLLLLDILIILERCCGSGIPLPNKSSYSVRYLPVSILTNQIKLQRLSKDLVIPDLEHQDLKKSFTILYHEFLSLPTIGRVMIFL